ncbi:hypothetical protein HOC35_02860 [Candidatus Woesearchaeota archaeon]|nr:hypothetical protein [Candidatus Woesearchaeota archaeon]
MQKSVRAIDVVGFIIKRLKRKNSVATCPPDLVYEKLNKFSHKIYKGVIILVS